MPSFCAVINCNDRYGHSDNISFHKFPLKRADLLKEWEAFIQQQRGQDWHASRWSSLCSRHFREEDFRSLNERKTLKKSAVPSVMLNPKEKTAKKSKLTIDDVKAKEAQQIQGIKESLEDMSNNVVRSSCRLCGISSIPAATFLTNYELYGMLQKCFPTLNIQQEDPLPKILCANCLKNLQLFGSFVDKVRDAQEELQRKYRTRMVEKAIKIKQEPVVRVKQEVAEAGYEQSQDFPINNEEYDGGDQQAEGTESERKYEFCDFPIINDCDIMEIINLDDPFINIPDDDNTTSLNEESEQYKVGEEQLMQQILPSAHDLLQTHLLLEEHNYAYVETEDFKEERNFYKTEKTEGYEQNSENPSNSPLNTNSNVATVDREEAYHHQHTLTTNPTLVPTLAQHDFDIPHENRAVKPIVTSVSAIQQPIKPNGIVVLNESIVKSGNGFQLHACMVCQMKFFSVESLKQHYTQTHGTPMVSVPSINLEKSQDNTCKTETDTKCADQQIQIVKHHDVLQPPESILSNCDPAPTKQQKTILISNKCKMPRRKRSLHYNLNTMALHYQQLRRFCKKLQKKCQNLEQNVEQLQSQPTIKSLKNFSKIRNTVNASLQSIKCSQAKNLNKKQYQNEFLKFECLVCSKNFSNGNSLRQHKITHTEERKHTCGLCHRAFKRRNGLLQHLKGFHLQVKPFTCPVCAHSYALKCDMQRCKHSLLKVTQNQDGSNNNNNNNLPGKKSNAT
ncbi:uncharacterized protein ACN427_012333 isoform 1-T1 [Glossina fuscipes fuscipes]